MPTLLVIDDDPQLRQMLQRLLTKSQYQVVLAESIAQALQQIKAQSKIDLILTDVMMPETTGIEGFPKLRAACPDTPIVAMSGGSRALNSVFNLSSAKMIGAQATLTKPFDNKELLACIEKLLA
ncbi:MAG: response regulator [Marinospirillum sp.]|uniref:response regulator n=1 Tax=Marinospirillum sp. TaxID=2183934 RepID=UPI001A0FF667|nr:response regulator [Marinospirillum sp.]MBE0505164.1 response regulator [Marinospirillum sp.]